MTNQATADGRESPRGPIWSALLLLRQDAPAQVTGAPDTWPRWRVLLPHVLAATGHYSEPLHNERAGGIAGDVAWLLCRAGSYLEVGGLPAVAKTMVLRALALDEAVYGPNHPKVAIDLNNLTWVLRDLGDPTAARPLAERALAIDELAYGPNHPEVANRLSVLAWVLRDLGDPTAARPLAERALAIDELAYRTDHPRVVTDLSNLAAILQDLGEHVDAHRLERRAIALADPKA